ncbi:HNH endonuclease [Haploplasma modicum]|uniref:HNH endonuclease n=1 Tax=Haploplasma modicum TaxID=2150 RepID=UPI0005568025|nr:HNH endonuclease [Haploplasma modicum]
MARKMVIVRNKEYIYDILSDKSIYLSKHLNESDSKFILYYKYLTHSDLPTFGKATRPNMIHKNLLYYLTVDEMKEIEKNTNRPFETAHQSNIGLPRSFWIDLGMNDPRINVKNNDEYEKCINNFADVYLVNDSLKYFNHKYTNKVFGKLNKGIERPNEWKKENCDIYLDYSSDLTPLNLSQAVHGIGTSNDIEFHKLRHNMFKNDILFLLIEKIKDGKNKLYIAPSKNPTFYTIIGESNYVWEQYLIEENKKIESLILREENLFETIESQTRIHQDKWRRMLAEEMMNYTTNDDEVFCPFTWVSADFNKVGTVFRASHIIPYSESNEDEKYDINNGLLLLANADALFDKYLISVDENKELIYSFLLVNDRKLINQLLLHQPIFKDVLNEKRMKYLENHRKTFFEREIKRKTE